MMFKTNKPIIPTRLSRLLLLLLLLSHADGFVLTPPPPYTHTHLPTTTTTTTTTTLSLILTERYYQLEEMEDSETCTTELFLSDDGTVELSSTETNCPLPKTSAGAWSEGEDGGFEMRVEKTFGTGVGLYEDKGCFTVERVFRGEVESAGEVVSMSGSMFIPDDITEDVKCGIFGMIDTTGTKFAKDEEEEEGERPVDGGGSGGVSTA